MQTANPYQSPAARVADEHEEYGEVKILSASGRLGRVRYIGYGIGITMLVYLGLAVVGALLAAAGGKALIPLLVVLGGAAVLIVHFMLTIQRCHDFNTSGWVSLVALIPLVGLIFWFVPGTSGPNRYGPPPPPNSTGAIVLASILPIVFVVGILAAIAIPAYQGYVHRAHQASAPSPNPQ